MTVQAQDSVQYYDGPINVGAVIPITDFTFIDNSHVSAKVRGNTEVWKYGYDYTISGAQTLIRTITVQRRVAENEVLAVYLDVPITQNISPEEGGNFPASTNEYVLDKLTYISQMLDERLKRSLQISIDTPFSGTLPTPEPNKALKISPDGSSFVMSNYDPDVIVPVTEDFKNKAQQAAIEALASQNIATEQANIATEQANIATEQANIATAQANIATEQATIATNKTSEVVASVNEALSNIDNAKTNALTDITDSKNASISSMDTAKSEALTEIETIHSSSVIDITDLKNTSITDITTAKTSALTDITDSKNASISSMDTAKSEALTEIETLHSSSITDITNLKNTSVSNITTAKDNAITSITNQETTSKNVLIDEGATQVGLIQNEGATQIANVQSTGFYMKDDQLYYINSQGEETKFKLDDIELNNPFSLFDSKYSDHELNNLSWLKSEGQWNSGTVYVEAYNELLREYNDSTSVEKTEGLITFKRTPKGYKIALKDQETAINTKYATDGIAWYYIIDTVNSQFKLPRTKFGFKGLRTSVGDDIAESLPNIKGDIGRFQAYSFDTTNPFYIHDRDSENKISGVTTSNATGHGMKVGIDASRVSSTYQDGAPVQERATQMYLYFYVGETVQNANIIDAGRIEEQLPNKVDLDAQNLSATGKSLISGLGFPSNRYTDLTFGTSGSTYTAPANGWYKASVLSSSNSISTLSLTTSDGAIFASHCFSSNQVLGGIVPITKNATFSVYYTNATTRYLQFMYAEGAKND